MATEQVSAKEMAEAAALAAEEKKASDIVLIEVGKVFPITDYFVICSGSSDRQTKSIADAVRKNLRDLGVKPWRVAGDDLGDWILLDYGDIVVHIFTEEMRQYYQLERLWKDAPQTTLGQA